MFYSGLWYLHERGVVHGDIKAENVLISDDKRDVKLCDFGVSRIKSSAASTMTKGFIAGTDQLMPPECIVGNERKGFEGDIWGAGGLFVEVFLLQDLWNFPPENVTDRNFMKEVMAKQTMPHGLARLKNDDADIYEKIKGLMEYKKEDRASAKDNLLLW